MNITHRFPALLITGMTQNVVLDVQSVDYLKVAICRLKLMAETCTKIVLLLC